jgi:hypothetical protein
MKKIPLLLLYVIANSPLVAGTYILTPQTSDGTISGSQTIESVTGLTGIVGLGTNDGFGRADVFVFAMPKIPFGEYISGANLSLFLGSTTGTFTFNGDLTSLGSSTSPSVLGTDYFNGVYGTAPDSAPIQQHFVTPATVAGARVAATSGGNAALAADLNGYRATGDSVGSYYFLRVNPDLTTLSSTNAGYNFCMTEKGSSYEPSLTVQTAPSPQMGRVLFEYWTGLDSSDSCNDLTSTTTNPNWPRTPSGREYSTVMEIPVNLNTDSGDRMRCYFYPPVTGNYTFAVASSDDSALLFSTTGSTTNATQIASVTGATGYQIWSTYSSQTSASIYLTAGQTCYMETRHKTGAGNSNFSIGWNPPAGVAGSGSIALMPATYCAPYDAGANYTAGAITSYVRALNHPRLMISPTLIARLANEVTTGTPQYDSVQAAIWTAIKSVVTGTGSTGTPEGNTLQGPLIGSAVIVAPTSGSLITAGRTLQDRVYYLALFYQLESQLNPSDPNIQGALNQIYTELTSAAMWGSTNNASSPGNWQRSQFLDLPEICHPFAIAYDWCYNGWTSTQRTNILGWIVNQALVPGITAYGNGTTTAQWWVNSTDNNWTTVCDGGLSFCALSVLNDETSSPQAPTVLNDFIPALNATTLGEWGPDGGWAEGLSYWAFSSHYLTTYFACLETCAATCFNEDKLSGISSIGSFAIYGTGPTNNIYNFSDGGTGPLVGPMYGPWCRYFGLKYNQPIYSYAETSKYPTDMVWRDNRVVTPNSTTPLSTYFQTVGTIFLRTAWNNSNALFAGMKAGFNANVTPYGSGHENEEIGSFVFDALGVRWIGDLGSDNYGLSGYFTTDPWSTTNRWQYYRKRAEGNNTLVINPSLDGGQTSYGTATITNFLTTGTQQQCIIDMTAAYSVTDGNASVHSSSTTQVTSAKRGFRIINGTAQLQDEIATSSTVDLNSFLHTSSTITINNSANPPTATLTSGTKNLLLTLQSPSGATFKSMAAKPLPTSPDYSTYTSNGEIANTGVNKLWIELSASGTTTLTVGFSPYVTGSTPPTPPAVVPLSNW